MKKITRRFFVSAGQYVGFIRNNPRYLAVGAIFFVTLYYNFVIAIPPESPDTTTPQDKTVAPKVFSDLDIDHPFKRYDRQLSSRKGDWYRVGLVAQSLDEDESLKVSFASALGKTQELGVVKLAKGDGEKYFEFVVSTDASYENVVVEKVKMSSSDNQWQGGQVRLTDVFVSRLDVINVKDAQTLQQTVFGEKSVKIVLTEGSDVKSGIKLPHDAHFLQGQTFNVSDDTYLLSTNIRIKQNNSTANGKYRIELRMYDDQSKKIGDQALQKTTFSVKDLKALIDIDGSYRLNIPFHLEAGKSYFLGVSDDYVKMGKKIELESFQDNAQGTQAAMKYFSLSEARLVSGLAESLMTHAVVEDLGTSFRYRYDTHHTITDMMDIFASSDKVSFDADTGVVSGKENAGAFFTYKVDTQHPFEDFRMEATQLGNDDHQIRLEYSFDNAFWKEIPVIEQDKLTKTFNLMLHNTDNNTKTVYVRVSYAGSKDGTGMFGLKDFRVTATMQKEIVQKVAR